MIKANELRIGNLIEVVSCFGSIEDGEMKMITDRKIVKVEHLQQYIINTLFLVNQSVGIPLTEEWLLRLGFDINEGINNTWGGWRLTASLKISDEHYIEVSKNNLNFGISKVVDDKTRELLSFNRKLSYVHQLQNLYFALTGEELITS